MSRKEHIPATFKPPRSAVLNSQHSQAFNPNPLPKWDGSRSGESHPDPRPSTISARLRRRGSAKRTVTVSRHNGDQVFHPWFIAEFTYTSHPRHTTSVAFIAIRVSGSVTKGFQSVCPGMRTSPQTGHLSICFLGSSFILPLK